MRLELALRRWLPGVPALFTEHHVNVRSLQLRVRDDKRLAVQWAYEVRVCACV